MKSANNEQQIVDIDWQLVQSKSPITELENYETHDSTLYMTAKYYRDQFQIYVKQVKHADEINHSTLSKLKSELSVTLSQMNSMTLDSIQLKQQLEQIDKASQSFQNSLTQNQLDFESYKKHSEAELQKLRKQLDDSQLAHTQGANQLTNEHKKSIDALMNQFQALRTANIELTAQNAQLQLNLTKQISNFENQCAITRNITIIQKEREEQIEKILTSVKNNSTTYLPHAKKKYKSYSFAFYRLENPIKFGHEVKNHLINKRSLTFMNQIHNLQVQVETLQEQLNSKNDLLVKVTKQRDLFEGDLNYYKNAHQQLRVELKDIQRQNEQNDSVQLRKIIENQRREIQSERQRNVRQIIVPIQQETPQPKGSNQMFRATLSRISQRGK
ncbi:Hypothetical_protein [Hexamita inflata]|uniref:Hypothetical_protein n=1 Tax=Hexamita inflata TaxID=28002 RepID=A0ABP1GG24_9EUKA